MNPLKPELVAPAGDPRKARIALRYGADAVYLATPHLGLRRAAGNFSLSELESTIGHAHAMGRRVYVAVNTFVRSRGAEGVEPFLARLAALKPDAFVVADAGVFAAVRAAAPGVPVHVSTQVSVTSRLGCRFWGRAGARRVILARETTLAGIRAAALGRETEIEVFVHGALCVGYSGKCLLSNYLAGRDANGGGCVQSCRHRYELEGGERGYLLNSRDLAALPALEALCALGVNALKIEGRMKSGYYAGVVTAVYRRAVDAIFDPALSPHGRELLFSNLEKELATVANRGYTAGALQDRPFAGAVDAGGQSRRTAEYAGLVVESVPGRGLLTEIKSPFARGQGLELILSAGGEPALRVDAETIVALDGQRLDAARSNSLVFLPWRDGVPPYTLVRKVSGGDA